MARTWIDCGQRLPAIGRRVEVLQHVFGRDERRQAYRKADGQWSRPLVVKWRPIVGTKSEC